MRLWDTHVFCGMIMKVTHIRTICQPDINWKATFGVFPPYELSRILGPCCIPRAAATYKLASRVQHP